MEMYYAQSLKTLEHLRKHLSFDAFDSEKMYVEDFLIQLLNNNQILQALSLAQNIRKHEYLELKGFYSMVYDYMISLFGSSDTSLLSIIQNHFYQAINNNAISSYDLAKLFNIKDVQLELFFLKQAADLGHPLAAYIFAMEYYKGQKVFKNDRKAFDYMFSSALLRNPKAMNNLGDFYLNGIGTNVNYKLAYKFLKYAYDLGEMISVSDIAFLLYNGLGIAQDQDTAIDLWKKYAQLGDVHCQHYLEQYALTQKRS